MPETLYPQPQRPVTEPEGFFPPTHWSLVTDNGSDAPGKPLKKLLHLATVYWKPLYLFARQRGAEHEDAADMVQGFFEHMLSREVLGSVEKRETRFRTFLLKCFTTWVSGVQRQQKAIKRGGAGEKFFSFDEARALEREVVILDKESPEHSYDRRWARSVYDNALSAMCVEIAEARNPEYMTALLHSTLGSVGDRTDLAALAERYGYTPGAVRKAAFQLRHQFSELVRAEVRKLVASEAEVDEELRYLISLMFRRS